MKKVVLILIFLLFKGIHGQAQDAPYFATTTNISTTDGLPENKIHYLSLDLHHNLNIHYRQTRSRYVYDGYQFVKSALPPLVNRHGQHAAVSFAGTNFREMGLIFQSGTQKYLLRNHEIYVLERQGDHLLQTALCVDVPIDMEQDYLYTGVYDEVSSNFFLGSVTSGLYKIQVQYFRTFKHTTQGKKSKIPNSFAEYYSQAEFEDDKVLINNYAMYHRGRVTALAPRSNFLEVDNAFIRAANLTDSYGRLWYDNAQYIFIYKQGKIKKLPINNDRKHIISYVESSSHNRFYALGHRKLFRIENDTIADETTMDQLGMQKSESGQYIARCTEEERLFLMTNRHVYCIDPIEKKCSTIQVLPIADYRIMSRLQNALYFVGTNGDGYFIYDGIRWTKMPLDPKGYLKFAHAALLDQQGHLWISTNCGIFRARLQDLIDHIGNQNNSVFYYYYDKSSGFNTNEFNGGCQSPAIQLQNGKFSFSSLDGMVQFDPQKVPAYFPQKYLAVSSLEIDGKPKAYFSDTMVLPSSTKEVKLTYTIPYFGHSDNFVLEYRTAGINSPWKDLSKIRSITLQNIHIEGTLIEVRVRVGFGKDDYHHHQVMISRLPHYYETEGFIFLLSTLLVLLIIGISKWHNRYTKQKNLELEYHISEKNASLQEANHVLSEKIKQNDLFQSVLAHDIKAPLRFIASNTKLLHDHWSTIGDNDKKQNLNYVIDSVTKMKSFVDETLLWIQIRNGELEAQKSYFLLYDVFAENLELAATDSKVIQRTVSLIIECDPSLGIFSDRLLITTVVRNLLSNSIKHSKSGTITLFAKRLDQQQLVIGCADQGKGISMELKKLLLSDEYRGNSIRKDSFRLGYVIIKEIARLLGATLKIESSPAKGTAAYLILGD